MQADALIPEEKDLTYPVFTQPGQEVPIHEPL